jgi:hypothetical protein
MEAAAPEVSGAEEEDESSEPQALRARATRTTAAAAAEHLMRVLMPFLSAGQIAGGVPAPSSFSYC